MRLPLATGTPSTAVLAFPVRLPQPSAMTHHPLIVKVSSGPPELAEILLRQSPNRSGRWGNVQFLVNQPVERCDWWVVLHESGLTHAERTACDPNNLVFVSMEPPDGSSSPGFLRQFKHIVSCDARITPTLPRNGLTWWAGIEVAFGTGGHEFSRLVNEDYDSFSALRPSSAKTDRVSVITSLKSQWPGHRRRLAFLDRLRTHPVSQFIDFFGGHHRPVADKLEALVDYKYHLVLENDIVEDWWTEKLADPLLAWCLPIYHGCPNIHAYMPRGSYLAIDIADFEATVRTIEDAVKSDAYSKALGNIETARQRVLNDYNIFNLLAQICMHSARRVETVELLPASDIRQPLLSRVAGRVRRLLS